MKNYEPEEYPREFA